MQCIRFDHTYQERLEVHIDRLIRLLRDTKSFMKEANVLIARLGNPIPRLSMNGIMRKLVQPLDISEVVDDEQGVTRTALGCSPRRGAKHPVIVGALENLVIAGLEVFGGLQCSRCEPAERMIKTHAKMKDDDGFGCRLGAETPVFLGGELGAGAAGNDIRHIVIVGGCSGMDGCSDDGSQE